MLRFNSLRPKKKQFYMSNGRFNTGKWFVAICVLPALISCLVFWAYVNVKCAVMAFQDAAGDFTLNHFKYIFTDFHKGSTSEFGLALKNTLTFFFVSYFLISTWNLIFSYFIYKKMPMYKFFRFVLYLPNMISGIVWVSTYKIIIGAEGPLMEILMNLNLIDKPLLLLNTTKTAMGASVGYSLWLAIGGNFLWFSGAMARIPADVLEAAELDGITPFKELIYIILPMISQTLITIYVLGITGILGAGGATLLLTFGEYGTMTLSFYITKTILTGGSSNMAAALGLVMAAITIPLVYIVKFIGDKISVSVEY